MKSLDRISGYGHVALRYGLEESIFLDSIMFWYKENRANGRNFRDGRWWTYNSVKALAQLFPWWSAKQLRRIIESCREQGAVLAENYNEDQRDRTLWYTPSGELLALYGMGEGSPEPDACIGPNGPTCLPERANMLAQTGKCYKEHVKTNVETHEDPPLPPQQSAGTGEARPSGLLDRSLTPQAAMTVPKPEKAAKASDEVPAVLDAYAGEDRELRERLEEFRETRKRKKKPLQTRRAAAVLTGKLDRLSGGDRAVKLALLDNAILHGGDSVYPLKEDELPEAAGRRSRPLRGEGVTYT